MRSLKFISSIFILFSLLILTACSPIDYNHVIINQSQEILEVEYEYNLNIRMEENHDLNQPLKMTIEQYEGVESQGKWAPLTSENMWEKIEDKENLKKKIPDDEQQTTFHLKKVLLKILPGEVVRIFTSTHINGNQFVLSKLKLKGQKGSLETIGFGFDQFTANGKEGFFSGIKGYQIVYR